MRKATAGVGMTPTSSTSTPALASPATTAAARNSPEARGSRPTTATRAVSLERPDVAEHVGGRDRQVERELGGDDRRWRARGRRRCRRAVPRWAPAADQRLLYCGALRAFFSPYFLRSLARASRVRKPAFFSAGRLPSVSIAFSARAMPRRSAPAWPEMPPPWMRAMTSKRSVVLEGHERLVDQLLVHLVREVVLQGAAVDRPVAGAGHEADPRDGLLAAAGRGAGQRRRPRAPSRR